MLLLCIVSTNIVGLVQFLCHLLFLPMDELRWFQWLGTIFMFIDSDFNGLGPYLCSLTLISMAWDHIYVQWLWFQWLGSIFMFSDSEMSLECLTSSVWTVFFACLLCCFCPLFLRFVVNAVGWCYSPWRFCTEWNNWCPVRIVFCHHNTCFSFLGVFL